MAEKLLGKEVNKRIEERIREKMAFLSGKGIVPTLCTIRIGEDPGDVSYEKNAGKRCESLGIGWKKIVLPSDVSQEELLTLIRELNQEPDVHGVLLFRPLPRTMDAHLVENALLPGKDVDAMTDLSLAGVFTGKNEGFPPCTPQACMEILDHYGIDCTGKKAVVVGRSNVVGKPAACMLLKKNATVTVCHTRTRDLPEVTREAEILVVSAGHADTIREEHLKDGVIVIDVGINVNQEGRLCGDVSMEAAEKKASRYTPVPGGVGGVTTMVLMEHTVDACLRLNNLKAEEG